MNSESFSGPSLCVISGLVVRATSGRDDEDRAPLRKGTNRPVLYGSESLSEWVLYRALDRDVEAEETDDMESL